MLDWLQASLTPWRFGAPGHEWQFKGFPERRTLARDLARLRGASGNITPRAQHLLDYYAYVSQEQIDEALAWEPIDAGRFFDCFLSEIDNHGISKTVTKKHRVVLTMHVAGTELTMKASFENGTLVYEVLGFFPGMITFASYEQWLGLGLSEWDRLDERSLLPASKTLAEIVRRVCDWRAKVT